MKKRIIAFYDLLLYTVICTPLIAVAAVLLFVLITKGTPEWIYENWHLVVVFAISFVLPVAGTCIRGELFESSNSKDDRVCNTPVTQAEKEERV
ncbi:MAG: hypothetical protein IJW70_09190 [Clostridia bacterium]|nr:hypothetical protein [Clostridia bacterium]